MGVVVVVAESEDRRYKTFCAPPPPQKRVKLFATLCKGWKRVVPLLSMASGCPASKLHIVPPPTQERT